MEKTEALTALSALAQETRLDIFRRLVEAGLTGMPAGQIGEELGVPPPTLSFHLKELRNAGMVSASKNGRSVVYRADFGAMNQLLGYLTENCCRRSSDAATPAPAECCEGSGR